MIRFYLYRSDPEQAGGSEYKNQIFAQVIMPIAAFVQVSAFFERAVQQFAAQGIIPAEIVEAAKKGEQERDQPSASRHS